MALYRLDDRHDARSWHRWRVIANYFGRLATIKMAGWVG